MKKKIVIVDDFEESCQLMVDILSAEFDCVYTCQSEKAIDLIQSIRPDIILMDYKMPHITGIELCKIIKNMVALQDTPIIFISGAVTSDERIETLGFRTEEVNQCGRHVSLPRNTHRRTAEWPKEPEAILLAFPHVTRVPPAVPDRAYS